jgi:pyruvate formate lyase activating enzyme
VSSLSVNPIEKKPVFHFYPGTKWLSLGSVGCNFRCSGRQNWSIAHWREGPMYMQYGSPEELVSRAKTLGCWETNGSMNARLLDEEEVRSIQVHNLDS